jgi:hypothetical protein
MPATRWSYRVRRQRPKRAVAPFRVSASLRNATTNQTRSYIPHHPLRTTFRLHRPPSQRPSTPTPRRPTASQESSLRQPLKARQLPPCGEDRRGARVGSLRSAGGRRITIGGGRQISGPVGGSSAPRLVPWVLLILWATASVERTSLSLPFVHEQRPWIPKCGTPPSQQLRQWWMATIQGCRPKAKFCRLWSRLRTASGPTMAIGQLAHQLREERSGAGGIPHSQVAGQKAISG